MFGCCIKLEVLYTALPPRETVILLILQATAEVLSFSSLKYFHTADALIFAVSGLVCMHCATKPAGSYGSGLGSGTMEPISISLSML